MTTPRRAGSGVSLPNGSNLFPGASNRVVNPVLCLPAVECPHDLGLVAEQSLPRCKATAPGVRFLNHCSYHGSTFVDMEIES